LIENDFLKLGQKELYKGDIASRDIEHFLIDTYSQPKSTLLTSIEAPADNDSMQLKDVAKLLDINYDLARKLAKSDGSN
jgi:hypothetical protein